MNDVVRIKKKFGEEMAHFCRANFASLLEIHGLLPRLLETHFECSRFFYTLYFWFESRAFFFLYRDF